MECLSSVERPRHCIDQTETYMYVTSFCYMHAMPCVSKNITKSQYIPDNWCTVCGYTITHFYTKMRLIETCSEMIKNSTVGTVKM